MPNRVTGYSSNFKNNFNDVFVTGQKGVNVNIKRYSTELDRTSKGLLGTIRSLIFGMNQNEAEVVGRIQGYLGDVLEGSQRLNINDRNRFAEFVARVTTFTDFYGTDEQRAQVAVVLDRIYLKKFKPQPINRPVPVQAPVVPAAPARSESASSVAFPSSIERTEILGRELRLAGDAFLNTVDPHSTVNAADVIRSGTVGTLKAQKNQTQTAITALTTSISTSAEQIAAADEKSATQVTRFTENLAGLEEVLKDFPTDTDVEKLNMEAQALRRALERSYDKIITKNKGGKFDRTELAAELKTMREIKNDLVRRQAELDCAKQLAPLKSKAEGLKEKVAELKSLSADPKTSSETLIQKRREVSEASATLKQALAEVDFTWAETKLAELHENSTQLISNIDYYVQEKGKEGFFEADEVTKTRSDIHDLIIGVPKDSAKEKQIKAIVSEMLVENRFLTNNLSFYLGNIVAEEKSISAGTCRDAVSKKRTLEKVTLFDFDGASQTLHRAEKRRAAATEKKKDDEKALKLEETKLAQLIQDLNTAKTSLTKVSSYQERIDLNTQVDASHEAVSNEFRAYVEAFMKLQGAGAANQSNIQIANAVFNNLKGIVPDERLLNETLKNKITPNIEKIVNSLRNP